MSGRPLPLLGTFQEFSIAVVDVRAAVEFYERLGFTHATTTDTYSHPYGVLTDGRLFIGVHRRAPPSPILTFVRPGLAGNVTALRRAGITLRACHVGEEVFNELSFDDPTGQTVAVLEARTYSPVARGGRENSLCGDFAEVSLPATDFAAARGFWEGLGLVAAEEQQLPYARLPLTSDFLELAFHRPGLWQQPLLVFRDPDMPARIERLRALGLSFAPTPRGLPAGCALLAAPEDTALLLLPEAD
jgi:catechol 2,3-dioxygenase-like lactoylglutathione lyase family enzyme